jgi:hypothetical protein
LEQLRKKRITLFPSKRRKNNDLLFSTFLLEGRRSFQLSYGRVDCNCISLRLLSRLPQPATEALHFDCAQFCAHPALQLNALTGAITANAAIVPAGSGGSIDAFVTNNTDLIIDINGYFAPPGTGGLSLYPLTPCRVLDSHQNGAPFNGMLNVNVTGSACGVSESAQAYVFNATVVPPSSLGYLTLWPDGAVQPLVSTLNAIDGSLTSNMAIVPTANGSISAFSSNPTQLILDISGYFAPQSAIIASVSQFISASQGGTISLPDGSSVSIPSGALASDQTVELEEFSTAPKTPPNPQIVPVGTSLVLTLSSPNPASSGQAQAPAAISADQEASGDLVFTNPQACSADLQGAAWMTDSVDTSGMDNFVGLSTSSCQNSVSIPLSLVQQSPSVSVSEWNTAPIYPVNGPI